MVCSHERATWDNFPGIGLLICNMGKANDVAHCCWKYEHPSKSLDIFDPSGGKGGQLLGYGILHHIEARH